MMWARKGRGSIKAVVRKKFTLNITTEALGPVTFQAETEQQDFSVTYCLASSVLYVRVRISVGISRFRITPFPLIQTFYKPP